METKTDDVCFERGANGRYGFTNPEARRGESLVVRACAVVAILAIAYLVTIYL